MIKKIHIENYKIFDNFDLELNDNLNIVVGNNEEGKSTILEAINIALTKKLNGRMLEYEITPYLFNKKCVEKYLESLKGDPKPEPPSIIIELYFNDISELASLRGRMNTEKEDCIGIKIEIIFDEDYKEEYANFIQSNEIRLIPAEYYKIQWFSFANNAISIRSLPVSLSYIDATTIRLQSGTDYYLQDIIRSDLSPKERVALSIAYRNLKELFSEQESIKEVNNKLTDNKGAITDKDLSISIDISQKSSWEASLLPHLDGLPFHFIGKGEQNALKIMLALERKAEKSDLILVEEPENHLSFSSMNKLVAKIKEKCLGKQIVITTHSAYVLNKLGLENLILINANNITTLKDIPEDTYNYFRKLPGYDTLRLVLANKAILVEGPSEELLIQKMYLKKHGLLPIEKGIDVISVNGLSFARFLDIAKELKKNVIVVTDNDGDYENKVDKKYEPYSQDENIVICRSEDNAAKTLEPQLIKHNDLSLLNEIFGRSYSNSQELEDYMKNNKTHCALKIFEWEGNFQFPEYINDAIS